ncbi:hypothetical protein [Pseudosulfitobacter pseudonitzschiae]|uniref:hypothetical protein n=1 Tax=Pseudosulfitobacter pseudonitzschiae TaxID=1402135 RepID=UPI003B77BADB
MFKKKEFDADFYVLRDPNWTGTIIMSPFGEEFGAEAIELCPGFSNGSLYFVLDRSGDIIVRGADHGDCAFPVPSEDQRLCLISSDPMMLGARVLEAMAGSYPMIDIGPGYHEKERSQGADFLKKLREAGVAVKTPEASADQSPEP